MKKLAHLEAMRGIAAIIVVVNHLALTFSANDLWFSAPWYVLINGGAAVIFFFVLSGYVLTLGPLRSNDFLSIAHGVIKRWPRLAGPVLIAVLLSCALWHLGAYWHVEAAAITGSKWLASFSNGVPPGMPQPDMSLKAALAQGTWRTFIRGERYFVSPLWTMKYELYGSMLAFLLASALIFVRRRSLQIAFLICTAVLVSYRDPIYFVFCLGVALAWLRSITVFELPRLVAVPILLIAIYFLGYSPNELGYSPKFDFYAWAPSGDVTYLRNLATYLYSIASVFLIVAVSFCSPLRQELDGAAGTLLGRYSFPIYLIHILAIFSIGTVSFVTLEPLLGYTAALVASVALSVATTISVAYLLTLFEGHWISFVNWGAGKILGIVGLRIQDRFPSELIRRPLPGPNRN